jgi:hypothetical protein
MFSHVLAKSFFNRLKKIMMKKMTMKHRQLLLKSKELEALVQD